jgi:type VI secretion system protein ImpC
MNYSMSFGKLSAPRKVRQGVNATFGLAVLGDFSGRANRGELETGAALAARKPRRVDVDNLDEVLERLQLKLHLPIGDQGAAVEVSIGEMDDFHPDQLYENVSAFAELAGLRQRLQNSATFPAAAAEVRSWGDSAAAAASKVRVKPRGMAIPNVTRSDFARLMGTTTAPAVATSADELIKQIVRPHIRAAESPDQADLLASVDRALSSVMRRVLHHPDFQTLESLWRSLDLLVRELETDATLQIILYDITAEEIAADLCATDDLTQTGLYQLFVEQPALDLRTTAPSVIVGNYSFEQTPPHADLLGRLAKVAAAAGAPFIAAIGSEVFEKKKPEDIHPLVLSSWSALRALPHAAYLGLAVPRFMLRWPYGAKTEPIDPFPFEEFTPHFGLKGFLWGNPANLAGLMLARTFAEQGMEGMELGSVMNQGDLPLYYYTDRDGDQIALPCTERIASEAVAAHVISQGFMPVLWMRGRPEVRLGSLGAVRGGLLAGPWAPVEIPPDATTAPAAAAAPPKAASPAPPRAPAPPQPVARPPAPDEDDEDDEMDDEDVDVEEDSDVEEAESAEDESATDDLDDLLSELESDAPTASSPATPAASPATGAAQDEDQDLNDLLASIEGTAESDDEDAEEGAMAPDLAALLAEL